VGCEGVFGVSEDAVQWGGEELMFYFGFNFLLLLSLPHQLPVLDDCHSFFIDPYTRFLNSIDV
jgi:hypothetical protein